MWSRCLRNTRPRLATTQKRFLNLHEYHAKELMAKHNIRVQRGKVTDSAKEAKEIGEWLQSTGAGDLVVKSQILAGGRGKGVFNTGFKGGVKVVDTPAEVEENAAQMLGNTLVTKQTGPEGQLVSKVLVHEGVDFKDEFYLAFLLDRAMDGPCVVVSREGGVDIEEVAESNPDAIKTFPIPISTGMDDEIAGKVADFLGFEGAVKKDAMEQVYGLFDLFMKNDCDQVEINPIVLTTRPKDKIFCIDGKLGFDENAAFRQAEVFALKDESMEDPRENEATKVGLNYVGMDGNVGCMVNGAGLAMATMDIIKQYGAEPANFLDVGGGATADQVEKAFRIITGDSKVQGILVNIFGGIMKCDTIAEGVVQAAKSMDLKIPLVVRLEGTNVEKGVAILDNSGLGLISATDLDDAAEKVVKAIQMKAA